MRPFTLLIASAITWSAAAAAGAGGPCAHCGCEQPCRYVTRIVPDVQRIVTYEYFCQKEPFCVPGRSCTVKAKCAPGPQGSCGATGHELCEPNPGPVYVRNQLYKRPVVVEKPMYRCVILAVCRECGEAKLAPKAIPERVPPPPADAPAPPVQPTSPPQPAAARAAQDSAAAWLSRPAAR